MNEIEEQIEEWLCLEAAASSALELEILRQIRKKWFEGIERLEEAAGEFDFQSTKARLEKRQHELATLDNLINSLAPAATP